MEWSAGTIEGLAPDSASVSAARKLARPAPWSGAGHDERAVWGLCKGGGARPYQTQVDLSGPAFKCSCPSRKIPCKHALALLLLRAADPAAVPAGEAPDWVREWLEERAKRAERPAPGEPPRDPEAAARRAAEREARVAGGVEDLRRWLRDAVRGGLGAERLRSWAEWDAFAARLVDAQAPGAASRLRALGGVAAGRSGDWPARLLEGLGLLHLLCEAYERADGPVRDDVRALLGWTVPREEVLAGPHVTGRWTVLARTVIEQERLRVQRTWLATSAPPSSGPGSRSLATSAPPSSGPGARSLWGARPALLLDFAPPGAPLEPRPAPGTEISAALAFHPGAAPLRALLASEPETVGSATGFTAGTIEAALAATAHALAANPWLEEWPVALAGATPEITADGWRLNADGSLPLGGPPRPVWRLLALSGGTPVSVFGLWNGARLAPLAASDGERVVPL